MWGADINAFLFLLNRLSSGVESIGPLHPTFESMITFLAPQCLPGFQKMLKLSGG